MNHLKWLSLLLLSGLSFFHIYYGVIPAWTKINSDFPNYYVSSKLLMEGKDLNNIYDDKWFGEKLQDYGISEPGKFSPFPPPTAFVLVPLTFFQPLTAKRIFIIINIIVLLFNAYFISKISGLRIINSFNLLLLSGAALVNNFIFGQFYLILLLLMLLGYISFAKNKQFASGIYWGISAAVKYLPVIYLPVLIFRKKWKALTSFAITVILLYGTALIFFGTEVYLIFFRDILLSHLNGELSSQSGFAVQFQSWNSLLRNLFIYDPADNVSPFINSIFLFNFFRTAVYMVFPVAALFILIRFKEDKNFIPAAVIILSLLVFILSPASASYHLLMMILPTALILRLSAKKEFILRVSIIMLFAFIGFSPFLLNKLNSAGLLIKYHRLWLEVVLFSVSFLFLLKQKGDYSLVNFRSEIPNGNPSTGDL